MTGHIIIILSTWLACGYAGNSNIHKQMSATDIQTLFQVDHIDHIPRYEVVPLHHVVRRHVIPPPPPPPEQQNGGTNTKNITSDIINLTHSDNSNESVSDNDNNKKGAKSKKYYDDVTNYDKEKLKKLNIFVKDVSGDNKDSSVHNLTFEAFGKQLRLSLRPTEGLIKGGPSGLRLWSATADPQGGGGVQYEEVEQQGDEEHIGDLYQDEDNMAAILLRRDSQNGGILVEGSIGHELVIRPLPDHLRTGNEGGHHHVVFKREANQEPLGDFAYMEPDRLQKRYSGNKPSTNSDPFSIRNSTRSGRSKRSAPHVIYPEILVIVDYDGYRLHGGDNIQVKRYFVSFWNGVDLRYRLLKGPRIRISIAGIIISRGRDATPYLERNRVGRDAIDSAAALTDMGKYLFRERRLPVYDIAVAVTKYDMCRRRKGGRCTKGTAGFAYVGGACVVNKRLEKVNSVAIIEDTGGFSGIIVAAHEVGHLLGAVHDGSPPPSYLGGPGAEKCRWEDGYIMSDLRHTERGFRWSPCSVQSFHHFLNGDTASCLHNAPHEDEALARALPGTLMTLDAQCRRDRGTSACFKDERVCSQLFCFDAASGYCVAYRPAAEGSPCGDGQSCLDGRCIQENENIIPDYSQHTPSYVRPDTNPYVNPSRITEVYKHNTEQPTTKNAYLSFYKDYFSKTTASSTEQPTAENPTTKAPFVFSKFWFTTTKNPYDFKDFAYKKTKTNDAVQSTTLNPLYESYYQRIATSTRNPYDFHDFGIYGRASTEPPYNTNYLKRSYDPLFAFFSSTNLNRRVANATST